ncbi:hypothetical protein BDZ94DRAFT_1312614 [Collybia nuda]|uniref:MYND-type domain-containing protein n=1 Tax=Collybia nuda TaxID=64659 RepID=A0A9P5XX12_9AGAR|nr:hypothetical protein BDZ94DRAFT_1312614 [Collybia nuda]
MNVDLKLYLACMLQRCWKCHAKPPDKGTLQRCGGCKRVAYCGNECQREDWMQHKAFCKPFSALEADTESITTIMAGLYDTRSVFQSEQDRLNTQTRSQSGMKTMLTRFGRPSQFSPLERELFSQEHVTFSRYVHREVPYDDGLNGSPQFQINQEIIADYTYAEDMFAEFPEVRYHYPPGPVKSERESLIDQTWRGEYLLPIKEADTSPTKANLMTKLRYSSDVLTLSMSILFALEKLNPGNDSWTKKGTITILLCGPELHGSGPDATPYEQQLLDCSQVLRVSSKGPILTTFSVMSGSQREPGTYHAYITSQGPNYAVPDVAIAFNTGCGAGPQIQRVSDQLLDNPIESTTWRETEKALVRNKAMNDEDAMKDEHRLKLAGAQFVPGLERQVNPWGSMLTFPRSYTTRGFQSFNRWIVGGFR